MFLYNYRYLFEARKNRIDYKSRTMKENQKKKTDRLKQRLSNKRKSNIDKQLKITVGKYTINTTQSIGKGSYGEVYCAVDEKGQIYAVKLISKAQLQKLQIYDSRKVEELRKRFETQIKFHMSLSDIKNIVKLYEMVEDTKAYYLFMQFCETDLAKYLKHQGPLPQKIAWQYFKQLLTGYEAIYNQNAFHRDLKPQNILMKNGTLKISDFGFVKIMNQVQKFSKSGNNKFVAASIVGSIKYMSPDILLTQIQNKGYDPQKSDIWSIGIILYKMLYGRQPYIGKTQHELISQIKDRQLYFDEEIPISHPKISLMKKLIEKKEVDRINFKELIEQVKKIDKYNELQQSKTNFSLKSSSNMKSNLTSKVKQLLFLNKLNKQIYYDAVNFASLRQIGFEQQYLIFSYKLMTLIHEKRFHCLENEKIEQDVDQQIKKQIAQYHNIYYLPIKTRCRLDENQTLQQNLYEFRQKLEHYEEYHLLMKSIQYYLLNLLLLDNYLAESITIDYIFTIFEKQKQIKDFEKLKIDNLRECKKLSSLKHQSNIKSNLHFKMTQ